MIRKWQEVVRIVLYKDERGLKLLNDDYADF